MNNPYNQNAYGQPVYVNSDNNLQANPYNQTNPYNQPYPPPPPPPPPAYYEPSPAALVIIQRNNQDIPCPVCGVPTQTIPVKKPGVVTYFWCCCLLWSTFFCFFIPFCIDSCMDTHLVCPRCNTSKRVINANCCG